MPRTIAGRHKNSNPAAPKVKDIAANPPKINDRLPRSWRSLFFVNWIVFVFRVFFSLTGNEANAGVRRFINDKKTE